MLRGAIASKRASVWFAILCFRLCSCLCCIRVFFKRSKRHSSRLQRCDSNGSSSAASDPQDRGCARKLVPRRACLGTRYLVLLMAIVSAAAVLGLGTYALVELHSVLSQLGCATGQAAATIINGQTFTTPRDSSQLFREVTPFASPFHAPSPFSSDAALATAEGVRPMGHPPISDSTSAAGAALSFLGENGT